MNGATYMDERGMHIPARALGSHQGPKYCKRWFSKDQQLGEGKILNAVLMQGLMAAAMHYLSVSVRAAYSIFVASSGAMIS